jgi:cullin-associated NEDD8-dissociated protein 1
MDEIWTVLLSHSKAPEESIRNIVAECIGKLCKIEPTKFLPALVDLSKKGDSLVRGCCATAVRFMIVDTPNSIADQYVHENLSQLLSSIDDKDLSVKRTTIMSLSSASHNKPRWAKELLPQLLPSLYRETAVNKELIHEVEMGPFKHIVDDGLDLRKSAYECLYSLMEHCLDRIDVLEFMNYIELGLKVNISFSMDAF